jgi:hypothetical protein
MRSVFSVVAVAALSALLLNCKSLSPAAIGDPNQHGFVLIEGEALIRTETPDSSDPTRAVSTRVSEIDSVTLENADRPSHSLHGEYKSGRSWFSDLAPGTYRVREVHVKGDPNEFTYRLPQDADPSALTFSVAAGELVYLGYIEIFQRAVRLNTEASVNLHPDPATFSTVRIALVRNKHEFAAWEGVYDLYARTKWEPLILKRMAETK